MTNEIATTDPAAQSLATFKEQLEGRSRELKMALPSHISPERFQRTAITAAHQNPKLLQCSRTSLVLACMKAATDGLLPDGREAALVPFKSRKKTPQGWADHWEVVYMPMVYGLRKKILQARDAKGEPVVSALEVGVVYRKEVEAGHFYYEVGKFPPLGHRPMLDLTAEDTTDDKIVGAYSIATMADGTKSYEFMRRFEIDKVQNQSQTGAAIGRDGKPRNPSGPWLDWYPEMAKKTVLRRHAKSLPQSGDLIIEAEDDEAALSAAALMAAPEAEPELITDESGDTVDSSTGEVVETTAKDAGPPNEEQNPLNDPEPTREGEDQGEQSAEVNDEADPDAKDPADAAVDDILAGFAAAQTLIDLNRLKGEADKHTPFMTELQAETVNGGYARHKKRLSGPKAKQPEPAK